MALRGIKTFPWGEGKWRRNQENKETPQKTLGIGGKVLSAP